MPCDDPDCRWYRVKVKKVEDQLPYSPLEERETW